MGIEETVETWIRMDLFCDGLGDGGVCVNDELERISEVAPSPEGAQKAILNAAVKARWRFDQKLQHWLCPACVQARDASERLEGVGMADRPPSISQRGHVFLEKSVLKPLVD